MFIASQWTWRVVQDVSEICFPEVGKFIENGMSAPHREMPDLKTVFSFYLCQNKMTRTNIQRTVIWGGLFIFNKSAVEV